MLLPADPKASFNAHAQEIRDAIERVLTSGHYILGPEVEAFEHEFSAYLGGGYCVGVANGTEAIELALRAVGVKTGDVVATVANTVTATVSAIEQIGAKPLFVEIDAETMTMSAGALADALQKQPSVRAVLPVHLYGHPADMPAIMEVAERAGVRVVEDCAQSHGACIRGAKAGTFGHAAASSFYPTKNLGAIGDGGAVFTRDVKMADRVRQLRQYGWRERYIADIPGRNSRLDELQAAILRVKLPHLEPENAMRRAFAERYIWRLQGAVDLKLPITRRGMTHAFHQFTVRTPKRDALRQHLLGRQISCGVLYPVPVHRQPAYAQPDLSLPETEKACAEVLCLPCHPGLKTGDIDSIADEILRWASTS